VIHAGDDDFVRDRRQETRRKRGNVLLRLNVTQPFEGWGDMNLSSENQVDGSGHSERAQNFGRSRHILHFALMFIALASCLGWAACLLWLAGVFG